MDQFAMDSHKLYWHLDRVLDWQNGKPVVPIYVEISPVSYCNHNCLFCGIDFARQEKRSLDPGILCTRLEEMGRAGVRSVMFAGEGEPLLYKELSRAVETARRSGMDVSLTTNGMAGDEVLWQGLLPHLTWVRFSVDAGTAPVYAAVHQVAESCFEKTLGSIEQAIRIKRSRDLATTIGVQFLLIDENLDDVETACRLFTDLGVDYLSFKPYSEHPQMIGKRGYGYNDETIARIERIVQRYTSGSRTAVIFRKTATERYQCGHNAFNNCHALPFWGYICASGDFNTCSVFIGDDRFKAGNIHQHTMPEILNGQKRQQSIAFAAHEMSIGSECRVNCRMARVNEFLSTLASQPAHINFI